MATDETRALARIRAAVRDVAKRHGLIEVGMVIEPPSDPEGHTPASIIFIVDDTAPPPRTGEFDDDFERVMAEAVEAEQATKAEAARVQLEGLNEKLKRPKDGIL